LIPAANTLFGTQRDEAGRKTGLYLGIFLGRGVDPSRLA
jgi:hypothetical protein